MKVLQINAVYEKSSTGRNCKELHEYMIACGIDSYVAAPFLGNLSDHSFLIGNIIDWKMHALLSRITGKQGHFSYLSTHELINYIDKLKPDVIHLNNLHGNYINLPMLLNYIAKNDIATVLTLHDCWFYTGKCTHYTVANCYKWINGCYQCPKLKDDNSSWFFDKTASMWNDKKYLFGNIKKLYVVGVSDWITEEAKKSLLSSAKIITRIYNWIDTEKFCPKDVNDLKKKLQLNNKKVIVGVADRWSEKKGLSKFIELANKLGETYAILLVGRMENDQKFPPNIISVGLTKSIEELVDYYNLADFFVTMSLEETFGKVSAEALSCGTPVICFNSTANPELVSENCGAVAPINDVGAMINEIHKLENKDMSAISKNCRAFAKKNFEKDSNIKQYIKLYKMICGEN